MARSKQGFSEGADASRGAGSEGMPVDHVAEALRIVGNDGLSLESKVRAISEHDALPTAVKAQALDFLVKQAGGGVAPSTSQQTGGSAAVAARPHWSQIPKGKLDYEKDRPKDVMEQTESGPSNVTPQNIRDEQAAFDKRYEEEKPSNRQQSFSTEAPATRSRTSAPTNHTRGAHIVPTMQAPEFGAHVANIHTLLKSAVSTLKSSNDPGILEAANKADIHLTGAYAKLSEGKTLMRGIKRGNKFYTVMPWANDANIDSLDHLSRAYDELNNESVLNHVEDSSSSIPLQHIGESIQALKAHGKTLQIQKGPLPFSHIPVPKLPIKKPKTDEQGNAVLDEEGKPVTEVVNPRRGETVDVKPSEFKLEDTFKHVTKKDEQGNPVLDAEGNPVTERVRIPGVISTIGRDNPLVDRIARGQQGTPRKKKGLASAGLVESSPQGVTREVDPRVPERNLTRGKRKTETDAANASANLGNTPTFEGTPVTPEEEAPKKPKKTKE